jgi:hypothetical protein
MTTDKKQGIEKITITRDERGWMVQVLHGPNFGISGHIVPNHKTLEEALDYIRSRYGGVA